MITDVDSDGTLKFEAVGGIQNHTLLGKTVQVGPKKLTGVIGARPIHLLKGTQRNSVVKSDNMRIDIGATKKVNANNKVKVGQRATFLTPYQESGKMAMGKALDDRAGCAALVELLRGDPYPFDLHAAFTVQEEVGLRGARVAAYATHPDVALVLECTPAYDLPNERDISPNVRLGYGPALYVMDAVAIQDPRFVQHIMRTASDKDIPFQIRQPGGGGTNAGAIQRMHGGIVTATIATPARYIHAPMGMLNLEDFNNVVRLAEATLRGLRRDLFER
jgi:endoglucanase